MMKVCLVWVLRATTLAVALSVFGCAGPAARVEAPVAVELEESAPLGEATRPRSVADQVARARAALAQKDYREAALAAQAARRLDPEAEEVRLLEAQARQAMGDLVGALPLWRSVVERGSYAPRVWAAYAELAVRRGEGEAALALFGEQLAAAEDPGQPRPAPALSGVAGWTALAVDRPGAAVIHLQRTQGTAVAHAFAVSRGRALLLAGDLTGAAKVAEQALEADSDTNTAAGAWVLLGDARRDQGLASGARDAYQAAVALEADHYSARVNLAVLSLNQGEIQAAVELLEGAAESRPGAPEAWHNLGLARRMLGQWQAAVDAYEQTLQVAPRFAPALKNLGILNEKYLERPGAAAAYYDRYLEQFPEDEEVLRWRKTAARRASNQGGGE